MNALLKVLKAAATGKLPELKQELEDFDKIFLRQAILKIQSDPEYAQSMADKKGCTLERMYQYAEEVKARHFAGEILEGKPVI